MSLHERALRLAVPSASSDLAPMLESLPAVQCDRPFPIHHLELRGMHTRLLLCLALLAIGSVAQAYDARAPLNTDLSGRWALNGALSDDVDAILRKRLEAQLKRERRWEEEDREADPDAPARPMPDATGPGANRVLAQLREVLAVYPQFEIRQSEAGAKLGIVAKEGARSFTAGGESLVSMPGGALATSEVGWDGETFVIERKVRKGPRVVEKFRLLKKTGQLEATLTWRGTSDDLLSGIKLKRVFDRSEAPPPADPDSGPVR